MMNCGRVQALLSAYVDREVTGHEMMEIRHHLHQCEACREEESGLRQIKEMMNRVSVPEPDGCFEDRLVDTVFSQTYGNGLNWRPAAYLLSVAAVLTIGLVPLSQHLLHPIHSAAETTALSGKTATPSINGDGADIAATTADGLGDQMWLDHEATSSAGSYGGIAVSFVSHSPSPAQPQRKLSQSQSSNR